MFTNEFHQIAAIAMLFCGIVLFFQAVRKKPIVQRDRFPHIQRWLLATGLLSLAVGLGWQYEPVTSVALFISAIAMVGLSVIFVWPLKSRD